MTEATTDWRESAFMKDATREEGDMRTSASTAMQGIENWKAFVAQLEADGRAGGADVTKGTMAKAEFSDEAVRDLFGGPNTNGAKVPPHVATFLEQAFEGAPLARQLATQIVNGTDSTTRQRKGTRLNVNASPIAAGDDGKWNEGVAGPILTLLEKHTKEKFAIDAKRDDDVRSRNPDWDRPKPSLVAEGLGRDAALAR